MTFLNLGTDFPRTDFLTSFGAAADFVRCCAALSEVRGVKINPFSILLVD